MHMISALLIDKRKRVILCVRVVLKKFGDMPMCNVNDNILINQFMEQLHHSRSQIVWRSITSGVPYEYCLEL